MKLYGLVVSGKHINGRKLVLVTDNLQSSLAAVEGLKEEVKKQSIEYQGLDGTKPIDIHIMEYTYVAENKEFVE